MWVDVFVSAETESCPGIPGSVVKNKRIKTSIACGDCAARSAEPGGRLVRNRARGWGTRQGLRVYERHPVVSCTMRGGRSPWRIERSHAVLYRLFCLIFRVRRRRRQGAKGA
ncbi:hypothetical protein MRX96_024409 [Rhipicephalus microplus]